MFNFTNHSVNKWNVKQANAARALGGNLIDVAIPTEVNPELEMAQVKELVDKIFEEIDLQKVPFKERIALVQTEYSVFWELTHRLQTMGFRLFVATTKRVFVEKPGPNGGAIKTVEFNFVRFRELN